MFHRESFELMWCKKDTLCKLRGNQGELGRDLTPQKPQFMHIDAQMVLVTSKTTLVKWIGLTLLTFSTLACQAN